VAKKEKDVGNIADKIVKVDLTKRSADVIQPGTPAYGQPSPRPVPVKKVIVVKEEKDVGNKADKIVQSFNSLSDIITEDNIVTLADFVNRAQQN